MNLREIAKEVTKFRSGFTVSDEQDEEVISEAEELIKTYVKKKCAEQREICADEVFEKTDCYPITNAMQVVNNAPKPEFD